MHKYRAEQQRSSKRAYTMRTINQDLLDALRKCKRGAFYGQIRFARAALYNVHVLMHHAEYPELLFECRDFLMVCVDQSTTIDNWDKNIAGARWHLARVLWQLPTVEANHVYP